MQPFTVNLIRFVRDAGQLTDVRLVNTNTTVGSQYEGRVEVLHNGVWGTVCSHGWSIEDALVVCRVVGFTSAFRAVTDGRFGSGSGDIWLDDVICVGNEESLEDCQYSGWESISDCDHSMDAGVVCSDG